MDFQAAINAHTRWKTRLNKYIDSPDGSLDPKTISLDCECDLGKWIYEEVKACGSDPVILELKSVHADFHKAAGDIVSRVNAGENVSAEVSLGAKSDFSRFSRHVILHLMNLRKNAA